MGNLVKDKSFVFALKVVIVCRKLVKDEKEYVLSKQLLRSGTAIGALIREAEHGESTKDFIHKLAIALKEANETEYWLELLHQSEYLESQEFQDLRNLAGELNRLLISIIKSTKKNNNIR